jgi:hypothetical protein
MPGCLARPFDDARRPIVQQRDKSKPYIGSSKPMSRKNSLRSQFLASLLFLHVSAILTAGFLA